METDKLYRYKCQNCKWVWLSVDYDDETLPEYAEGQECPICKSDNIYGYEVK